MHGTILKNLRLPSPYQEWISPQRDGLSDGLILIVHGGGKTVVKLDAGLVTFQKRKNPVATMQKYELPGQNHRAHNTGYVVLCTHGRTAPRKLWTSCAGTSLIFVSSLAERRRM